MSKGRPRKHSFAPFYQPHAGRWVIDLPASVAGTRQRRFFKNQSDALLASATIAGEMEQGRGTRIPDGPQQSGNTISGLIAAYLAMRENDATKGNLKVLTWGLGYVNGRFGSLDPKELTPRMGDDWIKSLPNLETRGIFNVFCAGRTFFNWGTMRDLQPINPFRDPPPKKKRGVRLPIFSVEQMEIILALPLKSFFKSWVVAGAFCGMRTIEFERMSHEAFDYKRKEINVRYEDSKQGEAARPRSMTIYPALSRHMPRGKGLLKEKVKRTAWDKERKKVLDALGLKRWPHNALRHSFASFHLSQYKSGDKTAYQMGHTSADEVYRDYANRVTRDEASRYWAL